jgi:eukaryotic-like serine/threonine-protein kinase
MNPPPAPPTWPLSPEQVRHVEQVCTAFEAAWKARLRPQVEHYLGDTAEPERTILLGELLKLDIAHRSRGGDLPKPHDYLLRFPSQAELVRELLAGPGAETPAVTPLPRAAISLRGEPTVSAPTSLDPSWPSIPGYQLLDVLGEGGMGTVYKARQLSLDRLVALKVLRKDWVQNPDTRRRIRREALAAGRLKHANIVFMHDASLDSDPPFLVMELVDGTDLQRLIKLRGPLPVGQACEYVRQAALGLQHAFERGQVHRDIKPANLIVTGPDGPTPGVVKILDMGLARWLDQEDGCSTLTREGAILGTPDFIAPEQAEDARTADIRADLYSLGCTLYFLLTGRVPFPEGTLLQKLDRHRHAEPESVEQRRPDVPPGVVALLRRLMAKRPADRYASPAALLADLDQLARAAEGRTTGETACWRVAEGRVSAAALTPDGGRAVVAGPDGGVSLWDVPGGKKLARSEGSATILSLALSPDGRLVLAGGSAGTLALWDVERGQWLRAPTAHVEEVERLAFAPDGRHALVSGLQRGHLAEDLRLLPSSVAVWDLDQRREVCRLDGHTGLVWSLAFAHPAGKFALSAGADGTVRVWDVGRGKQVRCLRGHGSEVRSAAFSPDARRVLSASGDHTLRLWETRTGRELLCLEGHGHLVRCLAFAPDGRRALTGASDRTVRLWDLATGQELDRFLGHTDSVLAVAFTADGRAVSIGADGTVRCWRLPDADQAGAAGLRQQADSHYQQGDHETALTAYTTALRIDPTSAHAWRRRGQCHLARKDSEQALADLAEALRRAPTDAEAFAARGQVWLERGEVERAGADLSAALQHDPGLVVAYRLRGQAYARLVRWGEAAADFREAARLEPDDPWAWVQLARMSLRQDDAGAYARVCRELLDRFGTTDEPGTANTVAWCLVLKGTPAVDPWPAVRLAERAVAAMPEHAGYQGTLGAALLRAGRYDAAVARLEAGSRPDKPEASGVMAWLFLALVHQGLAHPAEARASLDRAVRWLDVHLPADPRRPAAGVELAWDTRFDLQLIREEAEERLRA